MSLDLVVWPAKIGVVIALTFLFMVLLTTTSAKAVPAEEVALKSAQVFDAELRGQRARGMSEPRYEIGLR